MKNCENTDKFAYKILKLVERQCAEMLYKTKQMLRCSRIMDKSLCGRNGRFLKKSIHIFKQKVSLHCSLAR